MRQSIWRGAHKPIGRCGPIGLWQLSHWRYGVVVVNGAVALGVAAGSGSAARA
jgi:hypothetical protein